MVDWGERGEYIAAKHQIAPEETAEALADANAVVIDPDYNSKSGRTARTIGWSESANAVLTVITTEYEGAVYGVNAWKSNARDRRIYRENQGG